ncbi:queuosine precursor transporter [Candidatus Woesearchaeota archaeon]|nr:queuosine precursor transporter [Candidatus Woesearchaeota archaeon]
MVSKEFKTDLLLGLFIGALILANTLGTKITSILGVRVSVGIFFVPILFLVTDIIAEVHGRKKAKSFVYIALIIMTFGLIMIYVSILMPPNSTWGNQAAFASVFGATLRMTLASIVAFLISQLHDVYTFDFLKKKMKGKYLWLRNNVSTMISQFIDTTIFMFLAFYMVAPKFTVPFIFSLIIPYWLFKIVFAIIDTPFVYAGVWWLRKK